MPGGLRGERWFKNINGEDRYIVFDAAPIHDSSGNVIAAIETLQDITERKIAEEQLSQITREWVETFNTITDMVTIHDKDFNILRANKAAQKILGLPFLEVTRAKCFEYFHGMGCPPEGCPSCQCLVSGKPSVAEVFEPHLKMHIEIQAIPRFDSNNQVVGLIHVVRDITERKKSEEALASYSRELTELNTASNTLMLITNLGDIYQEVCNIIYSVFDLKMVWLGIVEEGNFQVKPVAYAGHEDGYLSLIRVTWDDSPTSLGPTGTAIKTRKPAKMAINEPAFAIWKAEAQKRGYSESVSVPLVYARDKCLGALNFYSDNPDYYTPDRIKLCQIFANQAAIAIENARLIEELESKVIERTKELEDANRELQSLNRELVVRREEADAASSSKTDFLANMSHELRTPLNSILGFSEIMLQGMAGPLTEKQKEFLTDISTSGNHLLSLITDILDLAKIEAGKLELEPRTFVLRDIIESSLSMFKEKAMKHGIKAGSDIDGTITEITADERKLKQVLVNLLSNAFKFTPDGGSIRVAARKIGSSEVWKDEVSALPRFRTDGNFIEISVSDTGIGISKDHQKKLFRPFHQIETSLTRKYAGTGLGLSLCRRLVELHGGRIWVESEPGKGSRFAFVIPEKVRKLRMKQGG
ncbi:MAG: PAS domain-containing protein [Nitrospirae bacterium]|nr:PAS domain-containing protein [Nitrospirota bacterium]